MTRTISLKDLQAQFNIAPGDEIVFEDAGQPIARIGPFASPATDVAKPREFGFFEGQVWISPDFDAPDPEFEDLFYNGPIEPPLPNQESPQ